MRHLVGVCLAIVMAAIPGALPLGQESAQDLFKQSQSLSQQGKNAEAIGIIQRAIQLDPANAEFVGTLGHYEHLVGRSDDAYKHALQAIALNPKRGWFYALAAIASNEKLDVTNALKYGRKVIALGVGEVGEGNLEYARQLVDAMAPLGEDTEATWPTIRNHAAQFFARKGIRLAWDSEGKPASWGAFTTKGPKRLAVQIALPLLERALAWLPDATARDMKMTIVLSGDIRTKENVETGGAADSGTRAIGLNVDRFHFLADTSGMATHEVFHILEGFRYFDKLDEEWYGLVPGFQPVGYQDFPKAPFPRKGFYTQYGQAKGQEDRADLFRGLLRNPSDVAAQAKGDELLAKKIEYLKAYAESISPSFGPDFWSKAARGDFVLNLK